MLPIPNIVDDYNQFMGGVDIADLLRAVYTTHMSTRRTWISLLFWMPDTAVTNSFLNFRNLNDDWRNKHRDFSLTLALYLAQNETCVAYRTALRTGEQKTRK